MRPPRLALIAAVSALAALAARGEDTKLPLRTLGCRETKTLRLAAVWGRYPLERGEPFFTPQGLALSPDGRFALVAAKKNDVSPEPTPSGLRLYDLEHGELVATIRTDLHAPLS